MILLITAIQPEANAVLTAFSMKKKDFTFPLYESETGELRLLVTGPGKLSAAIAVSAYLTRYPASDRDIFCNLGICGGGTDIYAHPLRKLPPAKPFTRSSIPIHLTKRD